MVASKLILLPKLLPKAPLLSAVNTESSSQILSAPLLGALKSVMVSTLLLAVPGWKANTKASSPPLPVRVSLPWAPLMKSFLEVDKAPVRTSSEVPPMMKRPKVVNEEITGL